MNEKVAVGRKKLVNKYMRELLNAPPKYRPGIFWEKAVSDIALNYIKNGLTDLRCDELNLKFFVPTFGPPSNGFSDEEVDEILLATKKFLNNKQILHLKKSLLGTYHALSDYAVFKASTSRVNRLGIKNFTEGRVGNPKEQFTIESKFFSRSALNYLLGLSFFEEIVPNFVPNTILEIGGGFGTLAEILSQTNLDYRYIDLDIPPMFLIAEDYVRACVQNDAGFFKRDIYDKSIINIENLPKYSFLPNWKIENLVGDIDLFVNFISFQEMEPQIVKNYAEKLTCLEAKYLMLRNLKEGKQVMKKESLGVKCPIKSSDYVSYFSSYELIARNLIPYGFETADGFNSEILLFKKK